MVDVLKEEEKLEEDAYAVLGGSDDKNCTYDQGYVNRQALYSCRTCMGDNPNEENGDIFGICLACSYACHADHELFELYTKRCFRCDCGINRVKENVCSLNPNKDEPNDKNIYNHNFIGKYCLCNKPYPNLEGDDDEEMAQCIICEDWFHQVCLDINFPEDYGELICKNCMEANSYLWYYQTEMIKIKDEENSKEDSIIVEEIKNEANVELPTNGQQVACDQSNVIENNNSKSTNQVTEEVKPSNGNIKLVDQVTKLEISNRNECKLKLLKLKLNIDEKKGTSFWDENWRSELCKCEECLKMYRDYKVEFLIDIQDTVHYYEAKGKEKCQQISQYERGLNEICKMNHVAGIEAIIG
jgi:E3 ubiquitin-protein ligase UBR7